MELRRIRSTGGLGEDPADQARPASARSGRAIRVRPRSDQPPSYVPMLIPVSTISRCPAASARRTSASTTSGARERSSPRARGMMQYVQWNEQPSWTLTKARVRSTETRSSAMPSMRPSAATASTPDSVGRAASSGACGPSSPSPARATDPQQPLQLRQERGLVLVAHQARTGVHGRECRRVHLDGAAGHDDLRVRVRAAGAADGGAGLLVGGGGHGAGVDEVEVRGRVAGRRAGRRPRAGAGPPPPSRTG